MSVPLAGRLASYGITAHAGSLEALLPAAGNVPQRRLAKIRSGVRCVTSVVTTVGEDPVVGPAVPRAEVSAVSDVPRIRLSVGGDLAP